jgi:hypothetical protein
MIIVSGCSWSVGELNRGDLKEKDAVTVSHGGLGQYIKESGLEVVNLGILCGSNLQIAHKIQQWIDRNSNYKITGIYVLQTDYTRDGHMIFLEDFDKISDPHVLPGIMISRFYSRLSEIANKTDCTIHLIGGLSDTLKLDNIQDCYPGLKIACQSMTNLLINDQPNVDDPVLSWYSKDASGLVKKIKKTLPHTEMENFLHEVDKGFNRQNWVFENPEWFWPDGCHPNRTGHLKLYQYLVDNQFI